MITPILIGFLAWPLLVGANSGRAVDPPEILEIRAAFARCQELREQRTTRRVSLFQVTVDATEAGHWQLSGPTGEEAAYSTMTVFVADQKVQAADLEEKTPSGDWQQVTSYCFRSDGTLAFALSVLRTFHGNVSVEDRRYFDRQGKEIRTLRSVSDLVTKKRVDADDGSFMDRKARIFQTVQGIVDEVGRSNVFP